MIIDENEPKKKRTFQIGQDVSEMSVDDLNETINELTAEIDRLKADIKSKQSSRSAADAFFKK